MRRQRGQYGLDSGGGGSGGGHRAYGGAAGPMYQQQQQQSNKSGYYQGRHQEQQSLGEKEGHQDQNQWRWERDGAQTILPQTAISPTTPFTEGQGREAPRSYYQGQRMGPQLPSEKEVGGDPRSQPHEEDMEIGYEDNHVQTFEGLEQKFLDDIMKLSKEQSDAEDAENARHRERINAINAQYEEQLVALRTRHASRRNEFVRREFLARQQQYQQVALEQYTNSGTGPSDTPRAYNVGTVAAGEPHQAYSSDYHDSYRARGRFPGNARDHRFEPKVPYPRGRSYGTGSRHY